MGLERDIQFIKGVGPKKAKLFKKIGVDTVRDLLFFFPRDLHKVTNANEKSALKDKEKVTLTGFIVDNPYMKKIRANLSMITTTISSENSRFKIVLFNRPYLLKQLVPNKQVTINGIYNKQYKQITVSEIQFSTKPVFEMNTPGENLIPVYKATEELTQKVIKDSIAIALEKFLHLVPEPFPIEFRDKFNIPSIIDSINTIHNPTSEEKWVMAKDRFIFEELVIFQSAMLSYKREMKLKLGFSHRFDMEKIKEFVRRLEFKLTNDQENVIKDVLADMGSVKTMNRLVQGDVGSGKTIVATIGLYACVLSGGQGVLLSPTEILAEQHYKSFTKVFAGLGINVLLLTSSSKEKEKVYDQIKTGSGNIIIGTHAILQEKVEFSNLSLIVTDEQHRFGVKQRALLRTKGEAPDVLVMSATPIPRTLSQVLYGDLDVSVIKEMPKGRKPILTYSVTPNSREKVYDFVSKELFKGHQCYIICPLVEESEKVSGESAVNYHKQIQEIFPNQKVGLLHGQQKQWEKEEVMLKFKQGDYSILVSTTVVEVGVDVPNATVMVIENAEKFGLAQLHQLRGRVGRSSLQSYCVLICHSNNAIANEHFF